MEKSDFKNRVFLPVIDLLVVVFLVSSMIYFIVKAHANNLAYPISDHWTIGVTGSDGFEEYRDVDLDNYNLTRSLGRVGRISLSRVFQTDELNRTTLRVYLMASDVKVFLDGSIIYDSLREHGHGLGKGRGYAFIEVPFRSTASRITISVSARDDVGLLAVPDIKLTNSERAYAYFIHEDWVGILVSIFIFVFGAVISVLSSAFIRLNPDYARLLDVGVFSVLAGIWLMSNQNVPLLFGMDPERNSAMGYMAILVAFLPLLSLNLRVRSLAQHDVTFLQRIIYMNMAVAVLLMVLHFSGIISFVLSVPVIHIMYIVNCFAIITIGVGKYRDMSIEEKIYHFSFIVIILAGFVYIALYYMRVLFRILPMNYSEFWFPLFTFAFVVSQIIVYLVHIYGMLMNQAQESALRHLAYNDALTGLYNRAHAEEAFAGLDDGMDPYAFINIDLNGLKKINDDCGHAQGDVFIASFGKILKEVFEKAGTCVRMGGDEFLVIISSEYIDKIDDLIKQMVEKEAEVSENMPFEVDAAYGVAKSIEFESPVAEHLYSLADERMYEMKVASKKARED